MNKTKLLTHIQFLRAISVLLVFFYHLKLNYFAYGYIGVDVFFVISGYVITSRIYSEYKTNNNFNYINFYKKRFMRIAQNTGFQNAATLLRRNHKRSSFASNALSHCLTPMEITSIPIKK